MSDTNEPQATDAGAEPRTDGATGAAQTEALSDEAATSVLSPEGAAAAGAGAATAAEAATGEPASVWGEPAAPAPLARPRTRWAGIIWGAVFSALALTVLITIASPEARGAFGDWLASLTIAGFVLVAVLGLGGLILLLGLLAGIRSLQRHFAR
ncbi:hypothetical protein OSC27_00405 [Microbacterium sp. STN6]|uniref:hypothetical protein n=1 Tax=Microbacterium sp. STN6 TaxID=2995588 RepID=UPI002260F8C9|nr:hypothetical protein [Microbacterium sp. STN6]MCX7520733.1 hypothetical protein [Microbacterium sp. STN6]